MKRRVKRTNNNKLDDSALINPSLDREELRSAVDRDIDSIEKEQEDELKREEAEEMKVHMHDISIMNIRLALNR